MSDNALLSDDVRASTLAERELDAVMTAAAGDMAHALHIVSQFEQQLAAWTGFTCCVTASTETGAVSVMLGALGLVAGDELIVSADLPDWVLSPLVHAGLQLKVPAWQQPLNADAVAALFSERTRALFVTPAADEDGLLSTLAAVCRQRQIACIRLLSTLPAAATEPGVQAADIGVFSLKEGASALSTGEGGALLFRCQAWGEKAKSYAQFSDLDGIHTGVNHKLSGVQCALGLVRLRHLTAQQSGGSHAG